MFFVAPKTHSIENYIHTPFKIHTITLLTIHLNHHTPYIHSFHHNFSLFSSFFATFWTIREVTFGVIHSISLNQLL